MACHAQHHRRNAARAVGGNVRAWRLVCLLSPALCRREHDAASSFISTSLRARDNDAVAFDKRIAIPGTVKRNLPGEQSARQRPWVRVVGVGVLARICYFS